jgi:hypothetical protein
MSPNSIESIDNLKKINTETLKSQLKREPEQNQVTEKKEPSATLGLSLSEIEKQIAMLKNLSIKN